MTSLAKPRPLALRGIRNRGPLRLALVLLSCLILMAGCSDDSADDPSFADGNGTATDDDGTATDIASLADTDQGGDADSIDVDQLDVGDCFNEPPEIAGLADGNVRTVEQIDCPQEHDSEVYYIGVLGEGVYPGDQAVEDLVVAACIDQFAAFVGASYETSNLEISYLYPGETSWEEQDRGFVCSVFDLNGNPLQGSMNNSGY